MDNLKYEHDKLQKKSNKQTSQVEKERDQVHTNGANLLVVYISLSTTSFWLDGDFEFRDGYNGGGGGVVLRITTASHILAIQATMYMIVRFTHSNHLIDMKDTDFPRENMALDLNQMAVNQSLILTG